MSSDVFLDEALREWFGIQAPPPNSWQRGELLVELIRKERVLLILDGLESLQVNFGSEQGSLQDPGMLALLKGLVANSMGLCICTSRFPLVDLEAYKGTGFYPIDLDNLSEDAGARYLLALGVHGDESELREASREFDNHPLALTLLGRYLVNRRGADIRRRDTISGLFADPDKGGHARRILREYENLFSETPELSVLRLLGLFDRPAEAEALNVLRQEPPLNDLTDRLLQLSPDDWATSLERLRAARLIKYLDPDGFLDCHQLVREHFSGEFRQANPEAFRIAQTRLFEYYSAQAPALPDTIAQMKPLFLAIYHGCRAGLYEKVRREVYQKRLLRGEQYFLPRAIGGFGSDLSVLSNFFEVPWTKVAAQIEAADGRWLMSIAGIALRGTGRLTEAITPTKLGAEGASAAGDSVAACRGFLNLSRLYLVVGQLGESVTTASKCVAASDRSAQDILLMSSRTALADALHQIEETAQAKQLFLEAETIQMHREPERPLLYSLQGYWYCEFLISQGEYKSVLNRAQQSLAWAGQLLLDAALCYLLLGKASPPGSELARTYFDRALEGLYRAGQVHYIPRGLLASAADFRVRKLHDQAERNLADLWAMSTKCGMRTHMVDGLIERSRLQLARGKRTDAIADCFSAIHLAKSLSPNFRRSQLRELNAQIS